ncbi:MAG: nuclear transport factor 2 family protein [Verrucomicrobia bacterium]|nr:nuclear transport factor 2 family protein [Verrucomicrobiota bacterium]MBI3867086.1 nuclear transport factor 2 family protein [Verrucomicrobiota bacterium]
MRKPDADPGSVVQRQLDAFNARDIETLLTVYADDAEMFEHPSNLLARGSDQLRTRFTSRFQEPNLHAALLSRVVLGGTVIDHERVDRTFPEGPGTIELVMIYEVRDGRISRAWSIAGRKTLHTPNHPTAGSSA